jgi:hypothetical protein
MFGFFGWGQLVHEEAFRVVDGGGWVYRGNQCGGRAIHIKLDNRDARRQGGH